MKKYWLAWRYFLRHKMSRDDKRNLRVGGVVSLYGFSFAIEKLVIHDWLWFVVYGILSILSFVWWFEDSILDLWERHTTEDDELYQDTK